MELPAGEFGHVVLLEHTHALFDLSRNCDYVDLLQGLILSCWVAAFVWPVTSGQNFYIQVNSEHLVAGTFLEVLHALLRHFDVFEHHLEALCELEATLFFEFLDDFLFSIFQLSP